MKRGIAGFEWDDGNWPKCAKHGVSKTEIEEIFRGTLAVHPDPSIAEPRLRGIGKTMGGRYVFVVFRLIEDQESSFIRPISARYMHEKEIKRYEEG